MVGSVSRSVRAAWLCAGVTLLPILGVAAAPAPASIPDFSSNGVSWSGYVSRLPPTEAHARTFNDYSSPASGPGPVTDDPLHPYVNNEVSRVAGKQPSFRVANVDNPNLKPWVVEELKKANARAQSGAAAYTREARCWDTGVPTFHLNPGEMYVVQTPKQVWLFLAGRVRRVYMNVPHSRNLKPSWYGDSVGRYENGDTLVVDTIGFNDKTFVDSYRTPHTTELHVVERLKLINGGDTLEVSFRVEDPGAFNAPWTGTRNRQRVRGGQLPENICAEDTANFFNHDIEPLPTAERPDF
jgi:hypothetical protein